MDIVVPTIGVVKTKLRMATALGVIGIKSLTAYCTDINANWFYTLCDKTVGLFAMVQAQGRCSNPVCHRITFMYGALFPHENLNATVHENLHEMFGTANMRSCESYSG